MSSSNDLVVPVSAEVAPQVSHGAEIHDKAEPVAESVGQGPLSLAAVGSATPRFNSSAVTVYRSPGTELEKLWAIWCQSSPGEGVALEAKVGHVDGDIIWDTVSVKDTQGNPIRSAFTPSLTVLGGQMHLIVAKPDGLGTLAHYVYIDDAAAWEYNAGWDVQPHTTASPSVTAFDDFLYLAFIADGAVNVCTYKRTPPHGVKYSTWSEPVATEVKSAQVPAIFTSPRDTGTELHLAVTDASAMIKEYAMGNSLAEWTLSALQPGGTTNGGVGACSTTIEAVLTAATVDAESPAPQFARWQKGRNVWFAWRAPSDSPPAVYSDVACAVFNSKIHCFYIGLHDSVYGPQVVSV